MRGVNRLHPHPAQGFWCNDVNWARNEQGASWVYSSPEMLNYLLDLHIYSKPRPPPLFSVLTPCHFYLGVPLLRQPWPSRAAPKCYQLPCPKWDQMDTSMYDLFLLIWGMFWWPRFSYRKPRHFFLEDNTEIFFLPRECKLYCVSVLRMVKVPEVSFLLQLIDSIKQTCFPFSLYFQAW